MDVTNGFGLLTPLATVKNPRRMKSTSHSLVDVLFSARCAAIAGCDAWSEVVAFVHETLGWMRKSVPLEHGVHSEDTFRRIFQMLDTGRFAACHLACTRLMATTSAGHVVAIEGKTSPSPSSGAPRARGSFDETTGRKALHLASAWATENHVDLAQVTADKESNEITAIPELLELLDLNNAVAPVDASSPTARRPGRCATTSGRCGPGPAVRLRRPLALGDREPAALDARCNFFRGPVPHSQGLGAGDDRLVATRGSVQAPTGHFRRLQSPLQTKGHRLVHRPPQGVFVILRGFPWLRRSNWQVPAAGSLGRRSSSWELPSALSR